MTNDSFSYIGKSMPKMDGWEFATGEALFAGDIYFPGILFGKILRSPHPHARILRIDTSKAARLKGVKAALTGFDAPLRYGGHFIKDEHVFAIDKVRYVGDEVAGVAAINEEIAEEALDLIEVEYEELPAVLDVMEGMKPEAPLIHENLMNYEVNFDCERRGNFCSISGFRVGDAEKGFRESDFIFEDTFHTQIQHQCYMEPHSCVATIDLSGKITIWTTTQVPYRMRSFLSEALGIPMTKIRIITTKVGGGFGGKKHRLVATCLLLAQKTNRPVKMTLTREEEFMGGNPRHSTTIHLKTGVKKDGTLISIHAELIFDTGAYADFGPAIVPFGGQFVAGRYIIPNIKVDGYCVYTNKISCGAFRGFGNPQVTFACESQMDIIAKKLGIDPLEIRLKNAVKQGDLFQTYNRPFMSVAFKETLRKASEKIGWHEKKANKQINRGVGLAGMIHTTGLLGSSATVKINEDGTATVSVGSIDIGTGTNTALIQIAAEVLGLPPQNISLVTGDTDSAPYDAGTIGSRVIYSAGNAVKAAGIDAREQILKIAAERLEANIGDLTIKNGKIFVMLSHPLRSITIKEASSIGYKSLGGPILGKGSFLPANEPLNPDMVKGFPWAAHPFPNFVHGTQAAEVEVDVETGEVNILNLVSVHDVGKVINPMGLRGQLIGGLCQGIGYSLMEKLVYDGSGQILTRNFTDYKIPRSTDIPSMEVDWVESNDPEGPFGAKGAGEAAFVATAPAIANAVYDAVGVRIKDLPITPDKILMALKTKSKSDRNLEFP